MTLEKTETQIRHDWSLTEIVQLLDLPLNDLLFLAHSTHRQYFDPNALQHVQEAGMKTSSGGIPGMGESREERAGLLMRLANLPQHPESVPINMLIRIAGTPMADEEDLDAFEFLRTVAVARIMMPQSWVCLSAGRESLNDEMQALCYFAGANSVFYGEKLLTTGNKSMQDDSALFNRLGLTTVDARITNEKPDHDMSVLAELKRSADNELFFNAMED